MSSGRNVSIALASILWLSPPGKSAEAVAEAKTGAGVVLALGGAIDVGLILSAIFARDHEDILYRGTP